MTQDLFSDKYCIMIIVVATLLNNKLAFKGFAPRFLQLNMINRSGTKLIAHGEIEKVVTVTNRTVVLLHRFSLSIGNQDHRIVGRTVGIMADIQLASGQPLKCLAGSGAK